MCKSARFELRDQPAGQSRDARRHAQACRQKQSAYGSDECPQPSLTTIFHRPKNDIGRVHRPGCEAETERSHFVASHVVRGAALREMASSGDASPSPAETAAQVHVPFSAPVPQHRGRTLSHEAGKFVCHRESRIHLCSQPVEVVRPLPTHKSFLSDRSAAYCA